MQDNVEWNHDRIVTAKAMINQAEVDMIMVLHRKSLNKGLRDRIVTHLRNAADDLEKMRID
jgi:hypothetical protein